MGASSSGSSADGPCVTGRRDLDSKCVIKELNWWLFAGSRALVSDRANLYNLGSELVVPKGGIARSSSPPEPSGGPETNERPL